MMRRVLMLWAVVVAVLAGLLGVPAVAGAARPAEAYPPNQVLLISDPVLCDANGISGLLTGAVPGSTVTFVLSGPNALQSGVRRSAITTTTTGITNAAFEARFTLPLPADLFGSYTVTATGTRADNGQPFVSISTLSAVKCQLPKTGPSAIGAWSRAAGGLLMGGVLLVVAARRRRPAVA